MHINKSLNSLILYVFGKEHQRLWNSTFKMTTYSEYRKDGTEATFEEVIFMGVSKHDGLVPLYTPDEPIWRHIAADSKQDIDHFLTELEICEMCMRDDELSLVVCIKRRGNVDDNGQVVGVPFISAAANKPMPRTPVSAWDGMKVD